jgi:hypothetical protein
VAAEPQRAPVIPGTGGLRKARFAPVGSGRGKSGAYRVGYVHLPQLRTVLLVTVWGKNRTADISPAERNVLARVIREIEKALES